jgi:hypothetical protein
MRLTTVLVVGGLVVALAAPARADHNGTPPALSAVEIVPKGEVGPKMEIPGTETSLDINLKLGLNGFRLGSRLFGRDGLLGGAWLNGETRKDGFSLDGRVEHEGKAHNFKFNADIDEWLSRILRWRGGALDL